MSIFFEMEPLHTMKVVTRRTGLRPDVIRVWERRYQAVVPNRSQSRRRLYTEAEIHRLELLRDATRAGHTISQVARLSEQELEQLTRNEQTRPSEEPVPAKPAVVRDYLPDALAAVQKLDGDVLETVLNQAATELGRIQLLDRVLAPLLERIGELWQKGELRVAHEHLATAAIRSFLAGFTKSSPAPESAPRMVITTPARHLHELGAILASVAADNQGWRVTYLGPSLPAEEIAGAAILQRARLVALSIVYPEDDSSLAAELRRLRSWLPPEVDILVGGRAAEAYRDVLEEIKALRVGNLPELRARLDELRRKGQRTALRQMSEAGFDSAGAH